MTEVVQTVTLPADWHTADVLLLQVAQQFRCESDGATIVVGSGLLQDQTNLAFVIYPGGVRWARSSPTTNWALEERFEGRRPRRQHAAAVEQLWRHVVEQAARAQREVRDAFGRLDSDEMRRTYSLPSTLEALNVVMHEVGSTLLAGGDEDAALQRLRVAVGFAARAGATREQVADCLRGAGRDHAPEIARVFDEIADAFLRMVEGSDQ